MLRRRAPRKQGSRDVGSASVGDEAAQWSRRFASAPVDAMQFYEDVFVPGLFIPWANVLLDEVGVAPGDIVLDVACGPGTVSRLAAVRAGQGGRVVGADISTAMLAIASRKPANAGAIIEYVESPAAPLRVDDARFDVVVCQQGLQFFPDRPAALAEMRRALRPGGRLGIAVWGPIDELPPFAGLARAVRDVMGDEAADRYEGGPWGFSSVDDLRSVIEEAGFVGVEVEARSLDVHFVGGPARFAQTLAASAVATDVASLTASSRARLAEAVERHLSPLHVDGALRAPTVSNIAVAHRDPRESATMAR